MKNINKYNKEVSKIEKLHAENIKFLNETTEKLIELLNKEASKVDDLVFSIKPEGKYTGNQWIKIIKK